MFDTGFAETGDELEPSIETIGVQPERVITTPADPNYIGGLDEIADRYAADSWVSRHSNLDLIGIETIPDQRYGNGGQIGRFTAVLTPGHEPDNHVLIDEAAGVAVMG